MGLIVLQSDWSFLQADASLLQSLLHCLATYSCSDLHDQTLRTAYLCRLHELLNEKQNSKLRGDFLQQIEKELTVESAGKFLDSAALRFSSNTLGEQVSLQEVHWNELIAATLTNCQKFGLIDSKNDALVRCLNAISCRNAKAVHHEAWLKSLEETVGRFPVKQVMRNAPSSTTESSSLEHALHFADLFFTLSGDSVELSQLFSLSKGSSQQSVAQQTVQLGCKRVAIQLVDDASYFLNVCKSTYPKRVLLEALRRAGRNSDWCVIRVTQAEWRLHEFALTEADRTASTNTKIAFLLHLIHLSS